MGDTINKVMRFQIIDSEGIDFKDFNLVLAILTKKPTS